MTRAEILARQQAIAAERRALHTAAGDTDLTTEAQATWDALDAEDATLARQLTDLDEAEARSQRTRESRARWQSTTYVAPAETQEHYEIPRGATRGQAFSAIMRANEDRVFSGRPGARSGDGAEHQRQFERLVRRHSGERSWAENILARSAPAYTDAFEKLITGRELYMSEDEKRAAIAVGTNTAGGYLVPTHLDPSLIITNNGAGGDIRAVSRVVTLGNGANVWHGVTTAGGTASWDGELVEVSDDTPAVASKSITVYAGKSLMQASIEAFEDIPGLTEDVQLLLLDEKERLESLAFMTGNGTSAPRGIFTALAATAGSQIVSATAATIAAVDIHGTFTGLPNRWRKRGTWLANPVYTSLVKQLGTAVSFQYSGDLRDPLSTRWLGHDVIENDDAPTTQTTTAKDSEIIYGDFSNYVIVDKPGSTAIEFIPHMFNTANNLPDGRRAWYMHFREGADSVNDAAFRLLVDKTSA